MKVYHRYICIISFGLLITFNLASQENMTLPKAISIALENNYGIQIADKYIEIADNNNTWAKAGKTPTIDLVGSFTNNVDRNNNPASFLQGTYYNGGLSLSANANYVVYSGGRIAVAKDQLDMAVSQQKLNKLTDIHSLLRTVYQQYYEVLYQQAQYNVLEDILNVSQDRLAYELTRKEYGASNSFNIIQFENAVVSDSSNLMSQSQIVEHAKRQFVNTLDISVYDDYTFSEELNTTPEELDSDKLKKILAEENYTLKSLDMISSLNLLNTKLAQSAKRPTVSLNGGIGFTENGFKFFADDPNTGEPFDFIMGNRINANINAQVSYNLYDGGVNNVNIQSARIQEEIDQLSIVEAKAELSNQLDILISSYNNQKNLLLLSDEQINLAQKNLDITEERFKTGLVTSLDFRNIQNQYLNAAFGKARAIYNLLITKSEIDFLVGTFQN